jgi:hypothetical protein
MKRRSFLQQTAAASLALPARSFAADAKANGASVFNAVQIQPFSFYDEGISRVLDTLQETAGINGLLVYSHLYNAGTDSPKEVLADDHGVPVREPGQRVPRRVWVKHSESAFRGSLLRPAAPDSSEEYGDRDLFAELVEPCRARGMKLMARILEPQGAHYAKHIENWTRVLTVDLDGKAGSVACWNNPDYRDYWQRIADDMFRHYALDGFMFGAERVGPLSRLLFKGEMPSCFCEHCVKRAESKGINVERVRQGFRELQVFITGIQRGDAAPSDGILTTLLRHFMRWPELLVWEREWALALEDAVKMFSTTVKAAKPDALMGRHVDHQQSSWDFLYRAAMSYGEMAASVDFIKPVVYHEITSPRVREWFIGAAHKSFLRELSEQQTLDLFYALTGNDPTKEPALAEMMTRGFSPDYVHRETKRCVDGVAGKALVYPGIGFDVPMHLPEGPRRIMPEREEHVTQAVKRAFEAGANGIVVCREYQEMRLKNLRAVGKALRELGKL